MIELFKSYLTSAVDLMISIKNLDSLLELSIKEMIKNIQGLQTKLYKITEFSLANSTSWTFNYSNGEMSNSTGLSKSLCTNPLLVNNIKIKKILVEGTSISSCVISYTTSTNMLTATWVDIGSSSNVDLDLYLNNIPSTGIIFRITNTNCVISKLYLTFEI